MQLSVTFVGVAYCDGLPFAAHAVESVWLAQGEGDVAHGDAFGRQQLGGVAVAALEVGILTERVVAEATAVVG